jgi:hypothetical protein
MSVGKATSCTDQPTTTRNESTTTRPLIAQKIPPIEIFGRFEEFDPTAWGFVGMHVVRPKQRTTKMRPVQPHVNQTPDAMPTSHPNIRTSE